MKKITSTLFLFLIIFLPAFSQNQVRVLSPDGQIQFQLRNVKRQLHYLIKSGETEVISLSELNMTIDSQSITQNAVIQSVETYKIDETYPWYGVHSTAVNQANGCRIRVKSKKTGIVYTLEVRAFNDGAAYRFIVPGNEKAQTPDEASTFQIPEGSTVWYHGLRGHYEEIHQKNLIGEIEKDQWAGPPVTIKLPRNNGYISITEAALTNYAGMALQANGNSGFTLQLAHKHPASYPYVLRYGEEEAKRLTQPAAISGEITTPWRVVLVAPDLNTLVNSDVIHNLCPAPDPMLFPDGIKTSWIKPGRAVWRYLDGGGKTDIPTMKEFCKLAGEMGIEYNVIEGFWRNWSDEEIADLVAYANQQKVGIWVWQHSKELHDPNTQEAFFAHLEKLGIVGAKIDFFDHEAKEVIDLYNQLLKCAARHHVLVNFHGANKPTGMNRTWPNELTREAVKGMESSKLQDRATHDVTLPFTRMLAGNADYTPMHFGERRANTTWAHQVASTVIFNSELLTFAANPQNIVDNPCRDMIEKIPSVWDETRVLEPSAIGEIAIFARRSGDVWFLAGMNGTVVKQVSIPLSFLGAGTYKCSFIQDQNGKSDAVNTGIETHSSGETIKLELQAGGGFVYRFSK